jgi:UDP-N-acetylglucosamine 1-carboxyvinyltransferase
MGITVERQRRGVRVWREGPIRSVDIQTLPFPGFPTDMQAQTMCLLAMGSDSCVITENVFENRFMFAAELARMGADIVIEDHHALVRGGRPLQGAPVSSTDLRAGAALVLAGLAAEGETRVQRIYHVDRGYEHLAEKLSAVGAKIRRIKEED